MKWLIGPAAYLSLSAATLRVRKGLFSLFFCAFGHTPPSSAAPATRRLEPMRHARAFDRHVSIRRPASACPSAWSRAVMIRQHTPMGACGRDDAANRLGLIRGPGRSTWRCRPVQPVECLTGRGSYHQVCGEAPAGSEAAHTADLSIRQREVCRSGDRIGGRSVQSLRLAVGSVLHPTPLGVDFGWARTKMQTGGDLDQPKHPL
jgi:hypothetical protein